MTKILKIFCLLVITACCLTCVKEGYEELLPYEKIEPVNFDMNFPPYSSNLWVGGAYVIANRGYKGQGIILVRLSDDSFRAYASACTKNINKETNKLTLSDDKLMATCPVCKTVYYLQQGAYDTGHTCHLQEYRVTYNPGTKSGIISN